MTTLLLSDTTSVSAAGQTGINWWLWVVLIELAIIIIQAYQLKRTKRFSGVTQETFQKVKNAKNQDVSMENVIQSINHAGPLYKELSVRCHPDRFVNTDLHAKAEELFQEVSRNKRDYAALIELKKRIQQELI